VRTRSRASAASPARRFRSASTSQPRIVSRAAFATIGSGERPAEERRELLDVDLRPQRPVQRGIDEREDVADPDRRGHFPRKLVRGHVGVAPRDEDLVHAVHHLPERRQVGALARGKAGRVGFGDEIQPVQVRREPVDGLRSAEELVVPHAQVHAVQEPRDVDGLGARTGLHGAQGLDRALVPEEDVIDPRGEPGDGRRALLEAGAGQRIDEARRGREDHPAVPDGPPGHPLEAAGLLDRPEELGDRVAVRPVWFSPASRSGGPADARGARVRGG